LRPSAQGWPNTMRPTLRKQAQGTEAQRGSARVWVDRPHGTQPRCGCIISGRAPGIARAAQPQAEGRNAVGVRLVECNEVFRMLSTGRTPPKTEAGIPPAPVLSFSGHDCLHLNG
jgi:hypothetical protein